ncbi:MAG: hypothetical protein JWP87_107 [Labilithrix sp.]|nr:hypothetical protein [Labilithrix sp.]
MTRNLLTLIAFSGVVALVACSSVEDDKLGSSDSFCSEKAAAECSNLAGVCGASDPVCNEKRKNICNTAASAATAQGRSYRAEAAQACLDKINEIFKEKVISGEGDAQVTKTCERVYGGTIAENGPCTQSFQCEGALICDRGICIAESPVALKGQCNNAGQVCEKGTYCQAQGGTKFCVEKNSIGDTCGPDAPCLEDLLCDKTCNLKIKGGEACSTDDECAPEAPYCDTLQKKCRPKYQAGTAACKEYGSQL